MRSRPCPACQGYAAILEVADRVAAAQAANKVNFDDFTTMLKTGLVEVVYEWARGMVSAERPQAAR